MKYLVAVRALCEFTAKQGDLDLRFTPSPTAREGIAGHLHVAAMRGADYQAEIPLSGEFEELVVRGRADGYDPVANRLDEVKTFRDDLERMPDNHRQLHWAQARIYGALLCQERQLPDIDIALVYFDIVSQKEHTLCERHTADELQRFYEQQCRLFLAWARQELAHRAARDGALRALTFPYGGFRTGQRDLAEAAYKAASTGRCLLAQAPTGIGKTIGTLFPLLKACGTRQLDKVFFLAAKTPGRALALNGLERLGRGNPAQPLRVLELIARDKACEHPDKACHGESCPLAEGFYDRLPAARTDALATYHMDRDRLREVALAHQICPYYLGQELARWSDVVVGDYNYFFDLGAMLHSMTVGNRWRVAVLVDEAHNLVDRARGMYSAELNFAAFRAARKAAKKEATPPLLKKALEQLARQWRELLGEPRHSYRLLNEPPAKLLFALQRLNAAITDYLADSPAGLAPELQRLYFASLHFCQIAELWDQHYLCDLKMDAARTESTASLDAQICLRNVVPAPLLARRFADAHSTVLFSATLSPNHYYRDLLGLPADMVAVDVASPFTSDQLTVRIADHVSTRYADRAASIHPIADLIAAQYAERPGNYLAFFSSFAYLQQISDCLQTRYPDIPLWTQARQMSEVDRTVFIDRFSEGNRGIGLAVLGGAFAEGIDLPGDRLIGAFIATLGLPQLNPVNEQLKQRMQLLFGDGYRYTYLYPGLQKVVQAAGRIIRTEADRGVLHLIDDRFTQSEVRSLMPAWWKTTSGE